MNRFLHRFMTSKSGVYCGPLKLLAVEVFNKCNNRGTACDLVTGEERKYASPDGDPSSHVSCTVEMTNISQTYEVNTGSFKLFNHLNIFNIAIEGECCYPV
jgi:ATP-dependent RNA helicase SUPV3L1/SUV3